MIYRDRGFFSLGDVKRYEFKNVEIEEATKGTPFENLVKDKTFYMNIVFEQAKGLPESSKRKRKKNLIDHLEGIMREI